MRFVDLFCGIGGFHYGLRDHAECVFACDTSERARSNYTLNHGMPFVAGDIRVVAEGNIPDHEVLCAGFPCQPFSASGNRLSVRGLDDPRGTLFREITRIAHVHGPSIMLLENVPRLLTMEGGKVWEVVKRELELCRYEVHASVLLASRFGIPQARRRLYIVCLKEGSGLSYTEPAPTDEQVSLEDVMEPEEDIEPAILEKLVVRHPRLQIREGVDETRRNALIRIGEIPKANDPTQAAQSGRVFSVKGHAPTVTAVCATKGERSVGGMYRVAPPDDNPGKVSQGCAVHSAAGVAATQAVGTGDRRVQGGMYRRRWYVRTLTTREVARVMGFPEDWRYECTERQAKSLLGNAVIPRMVGLVWKGIKWRGRPL